MRCIGSLQRSAVEAIELIGIIWIDPDHTLHSLCTVGRQL